MEHKVGKTYDINGQEYKLVKGDDCDKCQLGDFECQNCVPNCGVHDGHYVRSESNIKEREQIITEFCEKISKMEDCPEEFREILDDKLWKML